MSRKEARRRVDVAELEYLYGELRRKSDAASRIHEMNTTARKPAGVTHYHLGRRDAYLDGATLVRAVIDWLGDVREAGKPKS